MEKEEIIEKDEIYGICSQCHMAGTIVNGLCFVCRRNQTTRVCYIGAPEMFNLNQACLSLVAAFGHNIYLVGSSLIKRDYRDVDIRCILSDEEFDRIFPELENAYMYNGLWSLMCSSISLWLSQHTGLPIDFQIQKMSKANENEKGTRVALGLFLSSGDMEEPGTSMYDGWKK
jgi:hypothetical protein